ncbi:MAG TPA: hypothetical protein VKY74_05070, partial [Chloroflexia bacterium]|nr:hypothetical protein [Chloroflexia bacterium]
MIDPLDQQRPDVDFLIIADRAEAINGKLYMMGGAWDNVGVPDLSQPIAFSIALGILIPWNATNERHRMKLAVQDADGASLAELEGELVAGRPPHLTIGSEQRLLFATTFGVLLPRTGAYTVAVYL